MGHKPLWCVLAIVVDELKGVIKALYWYVRVALKLILALQSGVYKCLELIN